MIIGMANYGEVYVDHFTIIVQKHSFYGILTVFLVTKTGCSDQSDTLKHEKRVRFKVN